MSWQSLANELYHLPSVGYAFPIYLMQWNTPHYCGSLKVGFRQTWESEELNHAGIRVDIFLPRHRLGMVPTLETLLV